MSIVVGNEPAAGTRRRRWPWLLVALVVLAALAAAMFALGRSSGGDHGANEPPQPAPDSGNEQGADPPAPQQGPLGPVTWRSINGMPAPVSDEHGPSDPAAATGYSHDEPGAVIAAINQAAQQGGSSRPEATPQEFSYRIVAGDPEGDLVQVSLLARTPQATQRGAQARIDVTLRWQDDWQAQQLDPPQFATDIAGYIPIPRGDGG